MATLPKRHVKRVFKTATNPDTGEEGVVTDIFIDVLRTDVLPVNFQTDDEGRRGQIINYKFAWNDDFNNPDPNIDASNADAQFENANASRKTKKRAIVDPGVPTDTNSDTSIDDNNITLWLIERLKVKLSGIEFPTGQVTQVVFNNNPPDSSDGVPSKRDVSLIKVVNNDLNNMKMTDENDKSLIIDWGDYQQALQNGKTDPKDDLFLTVEVSNQFKVAFGVEAGKITKSPYADPRAGIKGQVIGYFYTEYKDTLLKLFDPGDPDATDADGNSAIIRLDPLQEIVNVGSNIIAVEFLPGDQ